MAHSHTAYQPARGSTSGSAAPAERQKLRSEKRGCGCGCADHEPTQACCDLVCFERPEYFCGHLLTDADLALDQRYVREKHKLYHRALHGHGIACGLRLTCDHQCRGHVVIGDGYAIDDCGNDLVVCEAVSFNVLGRLREKKLLNRGPTRDDCAPPQPEDDCRIRQCFYVIACYDEEPQEFVAPLGPACGPSRHACEPTRIRETVRFDVVDRRPKPWSPLDDLECRIERCFALLTEGPFAEELRTATVQDIAGGTVMAGEQPQHKNYCDAIGRLRVLLGLYLDAHPDHYNCTIREELAAVGCPPGPGAPGYAADTYGRDLANAVCRIVNLAYGYVTGCVLGELTAPCATPQKAGCVVLGTVEVEGDRVVRVCNCPRDYVWSFASFFQVLMGTLFGRFACGPDDEDAGVHRRQGVDTTAEAATNGNTYARQQDRGDEHECGCGKGSVSASCCRTLTPREGCGPLLQNLKGTGSAVSEAGSATMAVIREVRRSLEHFLDPTRTDATLLTALRGGSTAEVRSFLEQRHLAYSLVDATSTPLQPLDALTSMLHFAADTGDRIVLEKKGAVIVDARPETLQERVRRLEGEIVEMKRRLGEEPGGRYSEAGDAAVNGEPDSPAAKSRRRRARKEGQ